ncbi:MAG: aminotransferase class V-fold PLP-dependent enzyme, partial [Proteobacteria bacterium]|nr:aminotransferase class V-fold PLP-dependent enzyme [Pseudomonadota bacterium]
DRYGLVDPDDVKRAITAETAIISIMHANNEIGTIEPIEEIGRVAGENDIPFHIDAVQTAGKIPVNVNALNVDLLSLSGHKMYGPKGIGALYIRKGTRIAPILYGGHHEKDLRAGTENVPGIVGLGKACEIASRDLMSEMDHLRNLRDRLENGIMDKIDRIRVNGHPLQRLPHILNVSFENIEGEPLILNLDMKGIAASAGSACTSDSMESSHVLKALGIPPDIALGSVRLSLGKENTEEEIDYVINALVEVVEYLRDVSPLPGETNPKKQCVITFYETPDALRAEKVLKRKGLKFTLSSVPPEISRPSCCGVAILFGCRDREDVGDFLKEQDVEVEGIYQLEGSNDLPERKKRRFWPFGG